MMEGNILVIGKMAKCTEKGNLHGQMEGNTLEIIIKTKCMDKGEFEWGDGRKYVGNYY